jgi:hypothetical protein
VLRRLCAELLDRADDLLLLARRCVVAWLAPVPETPTDGAIREEGERLRKAFPEIDFDLSEVKAGRGLSARTYWLAPSRVKPCF